MDVVLESGDVLQCPEGVCGKLGTVSLPVCVQYRVSEGMVVDMAMVEYQC